MTEEPQHAHRSTAPADRAARDVRSAQAGSVETQRRPAPATGEAERREGPEQSHDERVATPVGADEHPERVVSAEGVAAHGGAHEGEEHVLGPIDIPAWGAALVGIAVAALVGYLFYLAIA